MALILFKRDFVRALFCVDVVLLWCCLFSGISWRALFFGGGGCYVHFVRESGSSFLSMGFFLGRCFVLMLFCIGSFFVLALFCVGPFLCRQIFALALYCDGKVYSMALFGGRCFLTEGVIILTW